MSKENIFGQLDAVLQLCRNLDYADPDEAEEWLEEAFPFASDDIQALREACEHGVAEGWLCNKGEGAVRYSRIAKPDMPEQTCSVDVVLMEGPGPRHRHPRGEVDLCFPIEGKPTFDGRDPGWVVYADDSEHVPTVEGGKMLILYILPMGEIEWLGD